MVALRPTNRNPVGIVAGGATTGVFTVLPVPVVEPPVLPASVSGSSLDNGLDVAPVLPSDETYPDPDPLDELEPVDGDDVEEEEIEPEAVVVVVVVGVGGAGAIEMSFEMSVSAVW